MLVPGCWISVKSSFQHPASLPAHANKQINRPPSGGLGADELRRTKLLQKQHADAIVNDAVAELDIGIKSLQLVAGNGVRTVLAGEDAALQQAIIQSKTEGWLRVKVKLPLAVDVAGIEGTVGGHFFQIGRFVPHFQPGGIVKIVVKPAHPEIGVQGDVVGYAAEMDLEAADGFYVRHRRKEDSFVLRADVECEVVMNLVIPAARHHCFLLPCLTSH